MMHSTLNIGAPTRQLIGSEKKPIARLMNVFSDPHAMIDAAKESQFARINPHYPGIRAAIDPALTDALAACLDTIAPDIFGIDAKAWEGQAWFSIVTLPPAQLTPIQRLPHFDGLSETQLAVMIYLGDAGHGGTNFYRQKETGFETVTEARYPTFKSTLENGVRQTGLPPAAYLGDGAPLYEKITEIPPHFNSGVFYHGCALHSGAIDNQTPLDSAPARGRLTINGFFRPRPE